MSKLSISKGIVAKLGTSNFEMLHVIVGPAHAKEFLKSPRRRGKERMFFQ
jgi:hypothetical protein